MLLLRSLQAGFRHLDPQQQWVAGRIIHTRHHREMIDIVFGSQQDEAIADFLHVWTSRGGSHEPAPSLFMCAKHLVDLPNLSSSSPRLRRLVIRSVELIGHQEFEKFGVEGFVRLLNYLDVKADDMDHKPAWTGLLLSVIKSPVGVDRLSCSYWALLLELNQFQYVHRGEFSNYGPQIMVSLQDAQEWDKLACLICAVWMECSQHPDRISRDLEYGMLLLFRQQPDSIRKLEERIERLVRDVPTAFRRTCEQGRLEAEQRSVPPYVHFRPLEPSPSLTPNRVLSQTDLFCRRRKCKLTASLCRPTASRWGCNSWVSLLHSLVVVYEGVYKFVVAACLCPLTPSELRA